MATNVINIDLDGLISKHKQFGKNARTINKRILIAIDEALDEIAEVGLDYAREKMGAYGISGDLVANLKAERVGDGLQISTYALNNLGDDYSMFVEFGTGLVGSTSPHPKAGMEGWSYSTSHMVNGREMEGWVYPSYPEDRNDKKWVGSDGNLYAFTKGQEARPFMYDTWLYLSRSWSNIMNKHINIALKEWGEDFQ